MRILSTGHPNSQLVTATASTEKCGAGSGNSPPNAQTSDTYLRSAARSVQNLTIVVRGTAHGVRLAQAGGLVHGGEVKRAKDRGVIGSAVDHITDEQQSAAQEGSRGGLQVLSEDTEPNGPVCSTSPGWGFDESARHEVRLHRSA